MLFFGTILQKNVQKTIFFCIFVADFVKRAKNGK